MLSLVNLAARSFGQKVQVDSLRLSEAHYQTQLPGLGNSHGFKYWDKGYLITYAIDGTLDASPTRPVVVLYDQNGRVAQEAVVWFKDSARTGVDSAAVTKSGHLVVSGGTTSRAGAIANYIANVDSTGHMSRVIRTTHFLPVYVCAAEDGTVWSYGFDRDEEGKRVGDSPMLRQYSFDKGQIRAMLNRSALNSSAWTLSDGRYPGDISLRCTSREVGLYNGTSGEWIRFDIATNRLAVAKVDPLPPPKEMRITGFALTESGDVFVSLHDRSSQPPRSGLFRLSFVGSDVGKWIPVRDTVGPFLKGAKVGQLLGTDGTDLIYTRDFSGTAYWSKYSK